MGRTLFSLFTIALLFCAIGLSIIWKPYRESRLDAALRSKGFSTSTHLRDHWPRPLWERLEFHQIYQVLGPAEDPIPHDMMLRSGIHTGIDFDALQRLPALRNLYLRQTWLEVDQASQIDTMFPALENLDFIMTTPSLQALSRAGSLQNLERVYLRMTPEHPIDETTLRRFFEQDHPKLWDINFYGCDLSDMNLDFLGDLGVESVYFYNSPFDPESLSNGSFENFSVRGDSISNADIGKLSGLHTTKLDLYPREGLSEVGLDLMHDIKGVEYICLAKTDLSGASI